MRRMKPGLPSDNTRTVATIRRRMVAGFLAGLCLLVASSALANHDTDCEAAGGTNGPGQLDCALPPFIAPEGSTIVLTSKFVYTPSTDFNPATCAVGTLSVNPLNQWLSIDTTVLDASSPTNFQEVEVSVDPSGLAQGVYDGTVLITLTSGAVAPQCPSVQELTGTVSVRLIVIQAKSAPAVSPVGAALLVLGLGAIGLRRARRRP